jgi:hypothetical protein
MKIHLIETWDFNCYPFIYLHCMCAAEKILTEDVGRLLMNVRVQSMKTRDKQCLFADTFLVQGFLAERLRNDAQICM